MKIFSKLNVFDSSLARIERLFNEFNEVVVGFSGGKDSTVVLELSLLVARKLGRLPLKVIFIDQEAEWQATAEIVHEVMTRKEVKPMWFQMPLKLFNATGHKENWLECWAEKDKDRWMRPQVDFSIKVNNYGSDRFVKLFGKIFEKDFPNSPTCYVSGVRAEESPARSMGTTHGITYKDITWGVVLNKKLGHYTFHPIYDWSYTDIWAAIHKNKWAYNTHYDDLYRYGAQVREMRVSNVHHETAVKSLWFMQEIEPKTYERLTQRISGIDMAAKMGKEDYFVSTLPFMFSGWQEYRDFLLEKLIDNKEWVAKFKKCFEIHDKQYHIFGDSMIKVHICSILTNDWELIKIKNFACAPCKPEFREARKHLKTC